MHSNTLILLVDDDRTSNFLNIKTIKKHIIDAEVVEMLSAEDGLNFLLESKKQDRSVDLILLDINMPELEGWDFILELRKLKIDNFKNIYMLSSSIDERDLEKMRGFPEIKGFITKPLNVNDLNRILDTI